MGRLFTKYAITAVIVVFVSEFAKKNDKLSAFVTAFPFFAILALIQAVILRGVEIIFSIFYV